LTETRTSLANSIAGDFSFMTMGTDAATPYPVYCQICIFWPAFKLKGRVNAMTRIIGISGSLRSASSNTTALLRVAPELMPNGATLEIASIKEIPLYDGDLEARDGSVFNEAGEMVDKKIQAQVWQSVQGFVEFVRLTHGPA
jgi:hypothetical protein